MSTYRKRRRYSGSYGRRSGAGTVIAWILVVFLVISLIPFLFSPGSSGGNQSTNPPDSVTDPPEPVYESGYLLYQLDQNGNKQYLNIRDTSTGFSLKTDPADACLYCWDPGVNTFMVADPDVNRFFGIAEDAVDSSLTELTLKTYTYDYGSFFAQFIDAETRTVFEGVVCPLSDGEAYYLILDGGDAGEYYYQGSSENGKGFFVSNGANAKKVYVEYVTREVVTE